ncbi:GntR family transcriptional regulator [Microbacterium sp. BWT-B31]|uniref:GntR family transcriptional regulator n=1 Tax=Microbacterium sp. BWT-B31 TaxID=3232072 RepID=UPI00352816A9
MNASEDPARGIERRGLRDQVYDLILERLLAGTIEPGARLSIDTTARELAVSPTPVREAMVQLERTGLVAREPLKGYRVMEPLDAEQLSELFSARIMLETTAVTMAAATDRQWIPGLRSLHAAHIEAGDRVRDAMTRGPVPVQLTQEYFAADIAFHRQIFAAAHNRYILDMYDGLAALTHQMRAAALSGPRDVSEATEEHAAILRAFSSEEPLDAIDAMQTHMQNARERSLTAAAP